MMRLISVIVMSTLFIFSLAMADIPKLINYQGMLTDDEGDPLTGSYNLEFMIYDDTTGGDLKWSEIQNGVQVENGLFNVVLGSQTTLNITFDESYWLAVKVGVETMPRIRITSVGYAYRAQYSDTAQYAHAVTPGSGSHWSVSDSVLYTTNNWGIARGGAGNELYGSYVYSHVNLGAACTTGTNGENYQNCTVGGGWANRASGIGATVGGGRDNSASGNYASVEGGEDNTARGEYATVGGGSYNAADTSYTTVAGGFHNTARGERATVGGGYDNTADTSYTTVGGGRSNTASGLYGFVGAGFHNTTGGDCATVGGGSYNNANTDYSTIAGGYHNNANGERATIGGGYDNTADTSYTTIAGGRSNTVSGYCATVGGGYHNNASGGYAAVPGGNYNTAAGDYSFAAGCRAKANHTGTFVWADGTGSDFTSTGEDQFLIRADGGVGIGTDSPSEQLDVNGTARLRGISAGSATAVHVDGNGKLWKESSSIRYKKSIRKLEVDSEKVLELSPVRFRWKTTQGEDVGLIAEDVEQVLPELVVHDAEGRPDAVKYDKVALYLLEMVKAQQERISALEREVDELRR